MCISCTIRQMTALFQKNLWILLCIQTKLKIQQIQSEGTNIPKCWLRWSMTIISINICKVNILLLLINLNFQNVLLILRTLLFWYHKTKVPPQKTMLAVSALSFSLGWSLGIKQLFVSKDVSPARVGRLDGLLPRARLSCFLDGSIWTKKSL